MESVITGLGWWSLVRRYNAIRRKVEADPNALSYTDLALMKIKRNDDFVETVFADKIPDTYGAPKHIAAE